MTTPTQTAARYYLAIAEDQAGEYTGGLGHALAAYGDECGEAEGEEAENEFWRLAEAKHNIGWSAAWEAVPS